MGNSAMDIAVESSYVAERTYLAARSGVWIMPKYIFGKPVDQLRNDPRIPFKVRQRFIQQLVRSYAGPPERYGLPKPNHRFGEAHPTVSGRILDRIQHGTITPKPNIEALEGAQVRFVDGSDRRGGRRRLLHRLPDHLPVLRRASSSPRPTTTSSCSAASFTRTSRTSSSSGCCSRSARSCRSPRRRARGSATTCAATTRCPPAAAMRADIAADQAAMRKRYVASKRHTIQVDFDDYLYALAKERAAGAAARARARLSAPAAMPTFCRHNRFVERCPICSKTLPGNAPSERAAPARRAARQSAPPAPRTGPRRGRGYARASPAARRGGRLRLAARCPGCARRPTRRAWPTRSLSPAGRLLVAAGRAPGLPDLYAQARSLVAGDLEQATWTCFLTAYLCPLEGPEPFAGIDQALQTDRDELRDLSDIPLGPRTSHDPARGVRTLDAYRQWVAHGDRSKVGQQALAFSGDASWSAQRRFERLFERIGAARPLARGAL